MSKPSTTSSSKGTPQSTFRGPDPIKGGGADPGTTPDEQKIANATCQDIKGGRSDPGTTPDAVETPQSPLEGRAESIGGGLSEPHTTPDERN